MRIFITISVGVLFAWLPPADASGCFGGYPDITPRKDSGGVPANARVTISRRVPAGVSWLGPGGQKITFRERNIGPDPSAARILTTDGTLSPGLHTIRTIDPDLIHTFNVVSSFDSSPPDLTGVLTLEAFNAPEPWSECPENIFIRARFPAPQDDGTDTNNLTYLVSVGHTDATGSAHATLVVPAETIVRNEVFFRFGETGCGCIPRLKLESGGTYRIAVRAVDAAGHKSVNTLSGTVMIPDARVPRARMLR